MLRVLVLAAFFSLCRVQGECIPKVFVLPLFHDLAACQTTASELKCDQLFVNFVAACADSTLK